MASQKKVIVRQFDGTVFWGYLPGTGILDGLDIQLLDTTGRVQPVPLHLVKTIAYVKDFNLDDPADPERLGRRTFPGRPRSEGLWLKLELSDKETFEGLAHLEFGFMDSLIEDRCVGITPPDAKSNTYRLLVPRSALENLQVLGLISPQVKRKETSAQTTLQTDLFSNS